MKFPVGLITRQYRDRPVRNRQTLERQQGSDPSKPITTLALLLFYSLFIAVYIAFIFLVARLSG